MLHFLIGARIFFYIQDSDMHGLKYKLILSGKYRTYSFFRCAKHFAFKFAKTIK